MRGIMWSSLFSSPSKMRASAQCCSSTLTLQPPPTAASTPPTQTLRCPEILPLAGNYENGHIAFLTINIGPCPAAWAPLETASVFLLLPFPLLWTLHALIENDKGLCSSRKTLNFYGRRS